MIAFAADTDLPSTKPSSSYKASIVSNTSNTAIFCFGAEVSHSSQMGTGYSLRLTVVNITFVFEKRNNLNFSIQLRE